MRRVGIKVLKNSLSEFVRAAEAGETVLVTDRDRVVAELRPPTPAPSGSDEAFLARGAREGWIVRAERAGPLPEPAYAPLMPFDEMMDDLGRSREDR